MLYRFFNDKLREKEKKKKIIELSLLQNSKFNEIFEYRDWLVIYLKAEFIKGQEGVMIE